MSYSCERLIFQGVNNYPLRTLRNTDTSRLGLYDFITMIFESVNRSFYCLTDSLSRPFISRDAFATTNRERPIMFCYFKLTSLPGQHQHCWWMGRLWPKVRLWLISSQIKYVFYRNLILIRAQCFVKQGKPISYYNKMI